MISTIYIEEEVIDHPRVKEILTRFKQAEIIVCRHYGEIFNRKSQNFRFQKKNPALILAKKQKGFVLPAPDAYAIGGEKNFYFSHMMNCIYDCRYCFLQGMYRSANYVLFVNYEDIFDDIRQVAKQNTDHNCYFFSGYDCDSLALEPVTKFVENALPLFDQLSNSWIELRTKSTQIRGLLERPVVNNCVVAFSLSPDNVVSSLEEKAPSLEKRIDAMIKLQNRGWPLGLRFDPIIHSDNYQLHYTEMFNRIFSAIAVESIHSVSLGNFRMPEKFFKNMVKLYPKEKMFADTLVSKNAMISYSEFVEKEMMSFCEEKILEAIPREKYFPCH